MAKEENQNYTRRVSFAAEPQINFIYQDESTTTRNSSFYSDVPMDITTDLRDLKLFENNAVEDFNIDSDRLFDEDNTIDLRLSLNAEQAKRMSLDPLRYETFDVNEENDTSPAVFSDSTKENNLTNSSDIVKEHGMYRPRSENGLDHKRVSFPFEDKIARCYTDMDKRASLPESIGASREANSSIFWKSRIKHKEVTNVDDMDANNSSFSATDMINTIDLKKIIPQEKRSKKDLFQFLDENGIRFLDQPMIEGMKRDTLSKLRTSVDPALVIYYEYALSERINFLYTFSNFLMEKMKDLQREIDSLIPSIDVDSINKENLKKIRNESRNKSKIDWYSLRKIYEIQFNKKILENKNIVLDIQEKARKESSALDNMINVKQKSIESLRSKVSELKSNVSLVGSKNLKNAEVLQGLIDEKRNLLSSIISDVDLERSILDSQNIENSTFDKRIDKLKAEIYSLKKNIAIKNVSESQLEEIKDIIERYRKIFKLSITKISKHNITLDLNSNVISIDFNSTLESSRVTVKESNNDPFNQFYCSTIGYLTETRVIDLIKKSSEILLSVLAIKKELSIIKQLHRVEYFYLNSKIYLRIFIENNPLSSNIYLDYLFDLYIDDELQCNALIQPGSLSKAINCKILKLSID